MMIELKETNIKEFYRIVDNLPQQGWAFFEESLRLFKYEQAEEDRKISITQTGAVSLYD